MTIDLTSVVSDPDDLAVRKALAESLATEDVVRSRFISIQLRASAERRAGRAENEECRSLESTTRAMLERHGAQWAREIIPLVDGYAFGGGFVEQVKLSARAFLDKGRQIYQIAPIRSVILTDAKPVIEELFASSLLDRLVELDLYGNKIGDVGVQTLVRSEHLASLRVLNLAFNEITRTGLEILAAAPSMKTLMSINLAGNLCAFPSEVYAVDEMLGLMLRGSAVLPEIGQELEAKYGDLPWLHTASRMHLSVPPTFADV